MTRLAIVEKLTAFVADPITTECQVVYILAEVRKLDEMSGKNAPQTLRMFLHWGLHVDLEGPGTIKTFVERIDDVVVNLLGTGAATPQAVAAETELYKEVTYFDQFRNELRDFLGGWGIPTTFCDDDEKWFDFVAAYTRVIEDGSLVGKNKKMVETVTFLKDDKNAPPGGLAYKWDIMFNDKINGAEGIELTVQYPRDRKNPSRAWKLV